jgi:hypothetical protein
MVGYQLKNTLTENGTVSRGVCVDNGSGYLETITERTKIQRIDGVIKFYEEETDWTALPEDSAVSMNCWGFTPKYIEAIGEQMADFFTNNKDKLEKAEFYLATVVQKMIDDNACKVKMLHSNAQWYGVTYPEDKQSVKASIAALIEKGEYPEKL